MSNYVSANHVYRSKIVQFFGILAVFLGAWFALAQLELHSKQYEKFTGGVLRPRETQPQNLQGRTSEELVAQLSQNTNGVQLRFDQATQTLVIEPEAVDASTANPWLRTTIRLAQADPYVFAQRRRYPRYQLVLFCTQQQRCITAEHAERGQVNQIFGWVLGADSREVVRSQMDIIRALITATGGVSTLDAAKTLNKLIWEAEAIEP